LGASLEIIDKTIDARKEREFNIIPIGDLHFGSLAFDNNLWNNFLKEIKNIKNPLFIITGDITDEDRPSTRDRRSDMFRDRIEAYIQEDIDYVDKLYKKVVTKLQFLNKNNCIGMIDGDHYRVLNDGRTSTEVIAMALGVPYLGNGQAIARLRFQFKHTSRVFNIHIRHGKEFSYLVGTKINNNKRFVDCWEGIDLFVKGHSHSAWEEPISRFIFTKEGFLYTKQIFTINCCSFRETFVIKSKIDDRVNKLKKKIEKLRYQGERIPHDLIKMIISDIHKDTDYPEKKEYPPVNNDLITFNIRFVKSRKEKGYSDYTMKTEIKRIPLSY
jgi:UDP-2,3-diacylglucosamine pyrophosphatase LpxH